MVWGGYLWSGGNKNLQAHTYWGYVGIQRGCLVMLPKHPIIANATAVAAPARHLPPPQPRSLPGFIVIVVVVVIVTAITTIFPLLSCDLFDCCVFCLSSCPLPFLIWWWPSRPLHLPSLLSLLSWPPPTSLSSLSSSPSNPPSVYSVWLLFVCPCPLVCRLTLAPRPPTSCRLLIVDLICCRQ